jgi:hypothetical protein
VNKATVAFLLLVAGGTALHGLEAGFIAGQSSSGSTFFYGLSAGSGVFVPMTRLEFEGYRLSGVGRNVLAAGVAFRPRLGRVAPYVILGAGAEFEKLNFRWSDYRSFTFLGGGCHLFLVQILSLRLDVRFAHFRETNTTRISGGIFLHI